MVGGKRLGWKLDVCVPAIASKYAHGAKYHSQGVATGASKGVV